MDSKTWFFWQAVPKNGAKGEERIATEHTEFRGQAGSPHYAKKEHRSKDRPLQRQRPRGIATEFGGGWRLRGLSGIVHFRDRLVGDAMKLFADQVG